MLTERVVNHSRHCKFLLINLEGITWPYLYFQTFCAHSINRREIQSIYN